MMYCLSVMLNQMVTPGGLTLDFFPRDALEPRQDEDEELLVGRRALQALMMGWPKEGAHVLLSWRVFRAVFLRCDQSLLRGMRAAFQLGFYHVHTQLSAQPLTDAQHEQALLYLSSCLNLLPFSDITPHESFKIPQYIADAWVLVDYRVVPIELTPTRGFEKLFIADRDRVFAYGLEPITDASAEPHLIFMGTTYPAGQGFFSQIHTDFEAFETPGKCLYRSGYERITRWLAAQSKKVHVCGTSLGGALALLLAIDKGNQLSRVDVMNPFRLYNPWRKSRYDHWEALCAAGTAPPVYVQKQGTDPISACGGVWKKEFHVFQVLPPDALTERNALIDHALVYTGLEDTVFVPIDPQMDNHRNSMKNYFVYVLLRSMVYYAGMLPYRYVMQPMMRATSKHYIEIAILLGEALVLPLLPVVFANWMIGLTVCMLAYNLAQYITDTVHILWGRDEDEMVPAEIHRADETEDSAYRFFDASWGTSSGAAMLSEKAETTAPVVAFV